MQPPPQLLVLSLPTSSSSCSSFSQKTATDDVPVLHASSLSPPSCTPQLLLLLELPMDLIRLILSYVAHSSLSRITTRFVCRRFRDLLPVSQETRQQARGFCDI